MRFRVHRRSLTAAGSSTAGKPDQTVVEKVCCVAEFRTGFQEFAEFRRRFELRNRVQMVAAELCAEPWSF